MLYILFLIAIITAYINYRIARKDIAAPAVIAILTIAIAILFAILGKNTWQLEVSKTTGMVFCVGFLSITLANMVPVKVKVPQRWISGSDIEINKHTVIMATLISAMCTLLYGMNAYRVGLAAGGSGSNAFAYMKNLYMNDETGPRMNLFIRQSFKIVLAIAYVHVFFLLNNLVILRNRTKYNFCYIVTIVFAVAIVIFSGSRTEIMQLLSSGIFIYSVLWREKMLWKKNSNEKSFGQIVKAITPFVLILMVIAFGSRNIVKIEGNALSATSDFLGYIVFYIGSPIAVLNRKIEYSFADSGIWFANDISRRYAHAQVYLGNLNYGGNTSTIFTGVLESGIIYMAMELFIIFLIATICYKSFILKTNSCYSRNRNLILYSMCYYVFTMAFYGDCVGLLYKFSNILIAIFTIFYYKFVTCFKWKFK